MNNRNLHNATTLNSVPGAVSKTIFYKIDALVVSVKNKNYSVDAKLRATYTRTYGIDGLLQGGSTKFYSVDAIISTPYKDNGAWIQSIGDNIGVPIDPIRLSTWSTYSRPANPIMHQSGINTQTGKIEYWNGTSWKNYDNSNA